MKFWCGNVEQRLQPFKQQGVNMNYWKSHIPKDNWDLHGGHGTRNCLNIHGNLVTKC